MLQILKRAAGFGDEFDADLEDAMAEVIAAPVAIVQPTLLNLTAGAVERIIDDAKTRRARLNSQLADCIEQLRQVELVISVFEPALDKLEDGYDAAEDGRKSYDAAIEAKRKRGDKHFRRPTAAEAAE